MYSFRLILKIWFYLYICNDSVTVLTIFKIVCLTELNVDSISFFANSTTGSEQKHLNRKQSVIFFTKLEAI